MFQRPLILILVSYTGGILAGHLGLSANPSLLIFLFLTLTALLLISLFSPPRLRFPCFLALFFVTGIHLDLNRHQDSRLLSLADQRTRVMVEGTVLEPVRVVQDGSRFVIRADRLFLDGEEERNRESLLVTIYSHGREFLPGDKILFPAKLRPLENFDNPGQYDYKLAMNLRGLFCAASVTDGRRIVPLGKGRLEFPFGKLEGIRGSIRHFLREKLSPRNEALFRALILGEKQGITQDLREHFNITGLGHTLVVSGLHIGLIAWLSFTLIRGLISLSYRLTLVTEPRKIAALMTCFPVIVYTSLTGFQVASQRAMIMVLVFLFSIIMGREKEVWSSLALAAVIVLGVDPHALFGISFQLSFLSVIGILWLGPAIYNLICPSGHEVARGWWVANRFYRYAAGLMAVTVSAVVFLLPITSFYFHRVSFVAVPANLTVVPILGLWILPLGLLATFSMAFSSALADLLFQVSAWGMDRMMEMIQFWGRFQWAELWVMRPNLLEIALYYALIIFLFWSRRWPRARIGLAAVLLLLGADASYWVYKTRYDHHLRVTYLAVGQGNAALVQFPGKERMLIDGGGFPGGDFDVGRMVIAPFLFDSKILRVDYLVLTHPQTDHMEGLRFIAQHFRPKEFWHNGEDPEIASFKELKGIMEAQKIRVLSPSDLKEGREISGVRITVLHPGPEDGEGRPSSRGIKSNDKSMVLKLSYEGTSCLFPGDLEIAGEEMVVSRAGPLLKSDILLVPHHGSKTSCSRPFLDVVRPRVGVISSGDNSPRFPSPETLDRLEAMGCKTIRVDKVGAVRVSIGPEGFQVRGIGKKAKTRLLFSSTR
ncbi:MAG: DNA internalization-related competence protein ComEC/Rec2 [Desulfobacterales bacterium]|nr:DNA internalization-related competence protein ComEC/Rec2 [Desulfobacterales bacterium]